MHCSKIEIVFVISTVPKVIFLSRLDKNILLGHVNTLKVKINN